MTKPETKPDARIDDKTLGLTDQEANGLLNKGRDECASKINAATDAHERARSDYEALTDQLSAGLRSDINSASTPERREQDLDKALSRQYFFHNLTPTISLLQFFAGAAALVFGVVVIPGAEISMFFDLFREQFENEFGEVSASDRWLIFLFSSQAVISLLAVKFFITSANRHQWLVTAAFMAVVLFVSGAVLRHADTQIAEATLAASTDTGLGWGLPDTPETADEVSSTVLSQTSAFLLSLGFVIVPIVGALLMGWGWHEISAAFRNASEGREYRRRYRLRRKARHTMNASERDLKTLIAQREEIESAYLAQRVSEELDHARTLKRLVTENRLSGLNGVMPPRTSGGRSISLEDLDLAETIADRTLAKLGNGYCAQAYAEWSGTKPNAPP